ncbi:MAG: glycine dehydrogenase, partial [Promethearchaeota archaeon]
MKYSNASLYDGATSLADAMIMALAHVRKRTKILVAGKLHPEYLRVVQTILSTRDVEIRSVSLEKLMGEIDGNTAAVVIQNPDFFGTLHNVKSLSTKIKELDKKIVTIQVVTEALSLALVASPGSSGIDITVGEAQSFGIPMSFGGPALGFIGVSDKKLLHRIPGRIVGIAKELDGDGYGFTLTLQAREQHIRRERALSNICSNEALNMLRAVIYLSSLGSTGLSNLAAANVQLAVYMKSKINELDEFEVINDGPTFNEFVIKSKRVPVESILGACEKMDILGPINLKHFNSKWDGLMLCCVTEMNSKANVDELIEIFKEVSV